VTTKAAISTGFTNDISVDTLIGVIDGSIQPYGLRAILNRTFEDYGNFVLGQPPQSEPGTVRFWGNFGNVSYGFHVDTDDTALIIRLTTAIRAHQQLPEYLAQPNSEQRAAERRRRSEETKAQRRADAARKLEAAKRELQRLGG
jgi:hypothetical protein